MIPILSYIHIIIIWDLIVNAKGVIELEQFGIIFTVIIVFCILRRPHNGMISLVVKAPC